MMTSGSWGFQRPPAGYPRAVTTSVAKDGALATGASIFAPARLAARAVVAARPSAAIAIAAAEAGLRRAQYPARPSDLGWRDRVGRPCSQRRRSSARAPQDG